MIEDGANVVVSHGNGPQVGMINNAFAYASANDGTLSSYLSETFPTEVRYSGFCLLYTSRCV